MVSVTLCLIIIDGIEYILFKWKIITNVWTFGKNKNITILQIDYLAIKRFAVDRSCDISGKPPRQDDLYYVCYKICE